MAENIVKNTNTNARIINLENSILAIAQHLGLNTGTPEMDVPKTSARIRTESAPARMATKSKKGREQDVIVTLTDAMVEGRMKLPARMFTKGSKCVVDGHTFTQQPADQNRSTKFNPEIFGYEVTAGDTLTFTHEGGREWSVEVEAGSRKSRKSVAKSAPAKREASKPARKADPVVKVARSSKESESVSQFIKRFAAIALKNASTKGFKQNENVKETGSFEVDARVYFTTAENQKFRSGRKALGLTFKKAVGMLNAEVYED